MDKKNNTKTRRDFIKKLGVLGAGTAAATAVYFNSNDLKAQKKGKKVKVLTTDKKIVEVDASDIIPVNTDVETDKMQHRGRVGLVGKKFAMVIDLAKCKNARKCMHACQAAHQLKPEQHHINVLEMEDEVNGATYFMPKPCMHCDEPQCVSVNLSGRPISVIITIPATIATNHNV